MKQIQVAKIIGGTRVEGPGLRVAVWTQGCTIKCPGCFNPELWGTRGGQALSSLELSQAIIRMAKTYKGTEGVTFLGGEPFDQAAGLAEVSRLLQQSGLSVMVFTGFTLADLIKSRGEGVSEFLSHIDFLVDGPFIENKIDSSRPWLGSTNQQFHFLTSKYSMHDVRKSDAVELRVDAQGQLTISGWATTDDLEEIISTVSQENN